MAALACRHISDGLRWLLCWCEALNTEMPLTLASQSQDIILAAAILTQTFWRQLKIICVCACGAVKEQLWRRCPQCSGRLIFISEQAGTLPILMDVLDKGHAQHAGTYLAKKTNVQKTQPTCPTQTHLNDVRRMWDSKWILVDARHPLFHYLQVCLVIPTFSTRAPRRAAFMKQIKTAAKNSKWPCFIIME